MEFLDLRGGHAGCWRSVREFGRHLLEALGMGSGIPTSYRHGMDLVFVL